MLLFGCIVPNRHILRQVYRLIFKPKFWRKHPVSEQTLDAIGKYLEEKRQLREVLKRHHANPP